MSISDFAKSDHSPATVNSFMTFATDYIPLVLKLRTLAGDWSLFYFCQLIQVSKISLPQIIIEYYLCILKLVRWSEISIQYGSDLIGEKAGRGRGECMLLKRDLDSHFQSLCLPVGWVSYPSYPLLLLVIISLICFKLFI